jgi:hypothetical protein
MATRIPIEPEDWIERKFNFDYPIGVLPAIMERVRGTPARLEEMVKLLPPETLTLKPGGEWSIQEHVGHLSDLEELHDGRLDDFDAGLDTLRAADMSNKKTHEANHNDAHIEDLLARFRAVRERFVARIEAMGVEEASRSALHPRLQKQMRVIDLALFAAEHDDHHLAAIRQIVAGSPPTRGD